MLSIQINGLTGNFKELTETTYWIAGNPGDWQWSIEDFGMSWGICPTFEEAFSAFNAEIILLQNEFGFSDADIMAMETDRVCERFALPSNEF